MTVTDEAGAPATTVHRPTRRELTRAATVEEIKGHAFRLMREQGSISVRFSDIAREMRMSAPALYRYFASRDDLLTALIVDSYDDLTAHLEVARISRPEQDYVGRLEAVCVAYRAWAGGERVRFALLFGLPLPDYAAPVDGATKEAAGRAFDQFQNLVAAAASTGIHPGAHVQPAPDGLAEHLMSHGEDGDPDAMYAVMRGWTILHGFTSLEAFGQLDFLGGPIRDALFDSVVTVVAQVVGLGRPA